MDLDALLRQHEGKRLEYKRDLSSPQPVLRTLVSFANTAGGVLVIGVEDGTRRVRGVVDPLVVEERLANLLSDSIAPKVVPEIEVLPWRSTHLVVVRMHLSPSRPHHLVAVGPELGVYVRIGSTNRRADTALIAEMGRSARHESFDELPLVALDSEALDFRAASESFRPIRALRRRDLTMLGLLTEHQGRPVPTIGGVLLFGRERRQSLPDAWMQLGAFAGSDRAHIVDQVVIDGPLPSWVEESISFVERNTARGVVIDGPRRRDVPAMAPVAVREAVVNAVVHADYSQHGGPLRVAVFADRIEVENPGLLPFGLTIDDIQLGVSRVRNRVLARVFRELGYVEQWGSGIGRMTTACLDAGQPAPEFAEIGGRFRVVISAASAPVIMPDNEEDLRLLAGLADGGGRSTAELAAILGRSTRATRSRLAKLVSRGLVVQVGSGPNDPRRRYYRSERGL